MNRKFGLIFLSMGILLACGAFPFAAPTATPVPPTGRFLYEMVTGEIYLVNADATNPTFLTNGTGPDWSPGGARIVFSAGGSSVDPSQIYSINADGEGFVRLTTDQFRDWCPAWSPDGQKIAFIANHDDLNDLYVMNQDGTNVRLVSNYDNHYGDGCQPQWSPDGSMITFDSSSNGRFDVYAADVESGEVLRITDGTANNVMPVWSPDGRQIAFASDRAGSFEIYVMNTDGSDVTRLTQSTEAYPLNQEPVWSPEGTQIAFTGGSTNIFTVDVNNHHLTQLTDSRGENTEVHWSPDGKFILFMTTRDNAPLCNNDCGLGKIYIMRADGTGQQAVAYGTSPDWEP